MVHKKQLNWHSNFFRTYAISLDANQFIAPVPVYLLKKQ